MQGLEVKKCFECVFRTLWGMVGGEGRAGLGCVMDWGLWVGLCCPWGGGCVAAVMFLVPFSKFSLWCSFLPLVPISLLLLGL